MIKSKPKDILIDADVVSHFITGGQLFILNKIYPNRLVLLDKVYNELKRHSSRAQEVQNLINFRIVELRPFPAHDATINKEYLHIKKMMFKGEGESACLAYVRHTKDIIGSSNLKDVKHYCNLHGIELLSTMDFLCEARKKGLLNEEQCDEFIFRVLQAGSKLPVKKMSDHRCH